MQAIANKNALWSKQLEKNRASCKRNTAVLMLKNRAENKKLYKTCQTQLTAELIKNIQQRNAKPADYKTAEF